MALNRFLREAVKQRMGIEFLINNAVSDIPIHVMRQIKREALDKYLPNDRRPIKAWGLAMASLRCLKRDLVKNRNKQIAAAASSGNATTSSGAVAVTASSSNMMTSNAFGLSQVEVVTTTTTSPDMVVVDTSAAANKPAGRRGQATIRELELNARRI